MRFVFDNQQNKKGCCEMMEQRTCQGRR